jgi:hypothetical protein
LHFKIPMCMRKNFFVICWHLRNAPSKRFARTLLDYLWDQKVAGSIFLKSGSLNLLEPSGPVKACTGIALPIVSVWLPHGHLSVCLFLKLILRDSRTERRRRSVPFVVTSEHVRLFMPKTALVLQWFQSRGQKEEVHFAPDMTQGGDVESYVTPFAKLRKATLSFVMSGRPHGTVWLPLDGF